MNDTAVACAAVDVIRRRASGYTPPRVQSVLTLSEEVGMVVDMSTSTNPTNRTGARPGRVRQRTTYRRRCVVTYHRDDDTARVLHGHGDCTDYCAAPLRRQAEARLEAALARRAVAVGDYDAALEHQRRSAAFYADAREMLS